MDTPTPEQLAKLPKWAQDHINNTAGERNAAIRALNNFCEQSKESPFSFQEDPCTGEGTRGPVSKHVFIQAHSIRVRWRGVVLDVDAHDYGNTGVGIKLKWSSETGGGHGEAALIPYCHQSARLVSKEDMR